MGARVGTGNDAFVRNELILVENRALRDGFTGT
jgi:hypothetical protein